MKAMIFVIFVVLACTSVAQEIECVWDLASLHHKQYPSIFRDRAITPQVSDFRGHKFNGFILHVANKEIGAIVYKIYTGKCFDFLSGTLASRPLTFQKRFYFQDNEKGESGINYWPVKGVESLPMRIYISQSITDPALDSLKIDYKVSSNDPITERILIDEVRQIPNTNLYLGKMYYRIAGHPCFFLWFVLEKRD